MTSNSNSNNHLQPLFEALEYKDMEGMLKSTIHVDEFASKMGDDDDIIVVSFFVRSQQAAEDLMNWFEKGYEWVLDADRSPGEIMPGRFLVYIEMRRRSTAGAKVAEAISDLETLTEFTPDDWTMHYDGKTSPFSRETFGCIELLTGYPRSLDHFKKFLPSNVERYGSTLFCKSITLGLIFHF